MSSSASWTCVALTCSLWSFLFTPWMRTSAWQNTPRKWPKRAINVSNFDSSCSGTFKKTADRSYFAEYFATCELCKALCHGRQMMNLSLNQLYTSTLTGIWHVDYPRAPIGWYCDWTDDPLLQHGFNFCLGLENAAHGLRLSFLLNSFASTCTNTPRFANAVNNRALVARLSFGLPCGRSGVRLLPDHHSGS